MKPRKNVIIRLCPFSICTGHPFTECTHPASVSFNKTFHDWSAISGNIFIWHYATNFDGYLLPFPNFKEFTRDLREYKDNNVNGIFLQGAGDEGSTDGDLRAWVAARLMWNPYQNPNALIDEWMKAVYGGAYMPMRAVFDHVQKRVAAPDKHLGIHEPIRRESWNDKELANLDSLYTSAEFLARGNEDALYYIRKNRMSIRYLSLLFNSGKLVLDGDVYRPEGSKWTREEYEQYRNDMTAYGVEHLREEPFDCLYEDLLGEKLRPHDTVSIENEDVKIVVAPDLGGRIVGIILKDTGENIVEKTDNLDYFYPCHGGYEESTTMTWGRTGFANVYTVEVKGRTMTLNAAEGVMPLSKGLIFKRTITLPRNGARIDFTSTVTNISNGMKYARLISAIEVSADPSQAIMGWKGADGKTVEQPAESFYKNGKDTPRGTWFVKNPTGKWVIENRFTPRDIEACGLSCRPATQTIGMEVLGFEKNLRPGEKIIRKHSWEIKRL